MNEETVNPHHLGKRVVAAFGPHTDFPTGSGPNSVALGDVNEDGHLDIVTANANCDPFECVNGTATVLLGDGTGHFSSPALFDTGPRSHFVALGDMNEDGHLDIVTPNAMLLGTGTGSFGAKADFLNPHDPNWVAIGDINADGHLDAVNTISVLLGNGTGGFASEIDYESGFNPGRPLAVVLKDVNKDGHLDIVTANTAMSNSGFGFASVYRGTGTGHFGAKVDFFTSAYPLSIALGDVNKDSHLDIVTAVNSCARGGCTYTTSVLLGDGMGGFNPKVDFPTGNGPLSVALGDVNGDGHLDIVTANTAESFSTASVLLGDGTGGFSPKVDFPTGNGSRSVTLGDVNEDGKLDIVTANILDNTVSVLINQATLSSSTPSQSPRASITSSRSISVETTPSKTVSAKSTVSASKSAAASTAKASKSVAASKTAAISKSKGPSQVPVICRRAGEELQINSYTGHDQKGVSIAKLISGGFVAVWQSNLQDGHSWGIVGQRYNEAGIRDGDEFIINTKRINVQQAPSVATLADGGFVVTWESLNQDGSGYGIYGQVFSDTATTQGLEFRVNTHTASNQQASKVVGLADGGFAVVWQSLNQDASTGYGIYAQRYDERFEKVGREFRVNSFTENNQQNPSIASLSNGGFVVSWQGNGQEGDGWAVYAQRYNTAGKREEGEFRVNTTKVSNQEAPSVAGLVDGGFIVTWQSLNQDGSGYGVYAKRYDAEGKVINPEFKVNNHIQGDQKAAAVSGLNDGGFIVTWESRNQDGSGYGVYGQRYNAQGAKQGQEFLVNTFRVGDQQQPAVASLIDNEFVVAWESNQQDGDSWGVYGQLYSCETNQHLMERDISIDVDDNGHEAIAGGFEIYQEGMEEHLLTSHEFREVAKYEHEYNEGEAVYIGEGEELDEATDLVEEGQEQGDEAGLLRRSSYFVPDIGSSYMLAAVLGKLAATSYEEAKRAAWQLRTKLLKGEKVVECVAASEEMKEAFASLKARCQDLLESNSLSKWTCYYLEDLLDELEQAVPETLTESDVEEWAEELEALAEEHQRELSSNHNQQGSRFFQPVAHPEAMAIPEPPAALPPVQGRGQLTA